MVLDAVLLLDQLANARARPKIGREPIGLRSLQESLHEERLLTFGQTGGAPRMRLGGQPGLSLPSVGLSPSTDTAGIRAYTIGDFGRREALVEQLDPPSSPPLQLRCAAVWSHESMYRPIAVSCIDYTGIK